MALQINDQRGLELNRLERNLFDINGKATGFMIENEPWKMICFRSFNINDLYLCLQNWAVETKTHKE